MKCSRCLNEDPRYFYYFQDRCYCRKCISYGKSVQMSQIEYSFKNVDYHLKYQLTPLQQQTSKQLVKRYQNHQNTILKAVCGAGKTEMIYEVIKYALNSGHNVCLTTPRKELVIELSQRLKSQFINIEPVIVYGGHSKQVEGQFVICTTHQLYRYRNYFDLLILDEYDAFPYYQNEVLENMLKTSIRGNYIFMTATVNEGDLNILSRYHQHDIPVPKCIVTTQILMIVAMILKLKVYQREQKPVLLFVPTIEKTRQIAKYLKVFSIKNEIATSQTKNIHSFIDQLKNHKIDVIVCTTVLERGITIADIQVIILNGEHIVYTKETLIQIAGRVGRIQPYVQGEVTIYTHRKTKAIRECIRQLRQDNALSATNH